MFYKELIDGKLISLNTGGRGEEITEEEYNRLLTEIRAKAKWVNDVYSGTPIADVPAEWQEEIQQRVEQIRQQEAEQAKAEVSDAELAQAVEAIL